LWKQLESEGKTFHWIRFDIRKKKFRLFSKENYADELKNFDESNEFTKQYNCLKFNFEKQNVLFEYYRDQDISKKIGVWEFKAAEWRVTEILSRTVVRATKRLHGDLPSTKSQAEGAWYKVRWASVNGETFEE
jgi:hypothetical protein